VLHQQWRPNSPHFYSGLGILATSATPNHPRANRSPQPRRRSRRFRPLESGTVGRHHSSGKYCHAHTLLRSYDDVFATHEADLGSYDRASHRNDTGDAPLIKAKLRRTAPGDAQAIEVTVKTLLQARVTHPSHGPWLSRPLVVPKANGDKRLVVDYRPLNKLKKN
jgi:hypothetical protein